MTGSAPRVLAVVLGCLAEPPDPALGAALGEERAARLRAAVAGHVRRVAEEVADVVAEFDTLPPDDELAALAGAPAPRLLLLAPDVPSLDVPLVREALRDLDEGCAIALSSGHEARACLVALATPERRLLDLVSAGGDRRAIVELVESAAHAGEVGFLRHERRLVTPADAAALAADPMAEPELRALARGAPDAR